MKSIFQEEAYNELSNRLNNLSEDKTPNWGKMNTGQMAWHCQGPLNIVLGHNNYNMKTNWFVKTFFKKSMYNDKPWRKNLPTVPVFKAQEARDFTIEKAKLIALVNELYSQKDKEQWVAHPLFGAFTKEQWSKMQYKHLDHHLRQFGV